MNLSRLWLIAGALLLSACGAATDPESDSALEPQARVQVVHPQLRTLTQTLDAIGRVSSGAEDLHTISAASELVVDRVAVRLGALVAQNDRLLLVHASDNAVAELTAAQTSLAFAQQALDRIKKRRAAQLATNAEVDAAAQSLALARAASASAAARIASRDPHWLLAPRDASVSAIEVQPGMRVAADTLLLRLDAAVGTELRLMLEPAAATAVKTGMAVAVARVGRAPLAGRVAQLLPQLDPISHQRVVIVTLAPPNGLAVGELVRATITVAQHANALSVPRSAVQFDVQQQAYVFVVRDGKARRIAVSIGAAALDTAVEVTLGLSTEDPVVFEGGSVLSDGMKVAIVAPQ